MIETSLVANISPHIGQPLTPAESQIGGLAAPAQVKAFLGAFPDYAPTPLVPLDGLARELGVAGIDIKDESGRYGLSSFKALGGAYAVARLVHRFVEARLGRKVDPAELLSDESRSLASGLTVCCATDGNHGRSVAAGARMFGCRCVIYLHAGVSEGREHAIAGFGARIVRIAGSYDDSVAEAAEAARREGWLTVSDFSWPGYEEIPGLVMQGYTIMLDEIAAQAAAPYTHIFVQAGVGGLAAVVAGYFHERYAGKGPRTIVVEPALANCLQRSALANERRAMPAGEATVMAMLECYEPSLIAWNILEKSAGFYLGVDDGWAVAALKRLARPAGGDPALTIGESGAAGLAGLLAVAQDEKLRSALGLDAASRILLIGTEGATDPEVYQALLQS
ncbi:diaminopropionate ammonia-lyase [Pseudochelatococcus sp. B33]